ncbi:MAG: glycosyltransferase N-terminal domain-containing protein [Vicingaceae bacterium]|jgi:3-deoxy-D-manno-octulosonic-acid transferase|nr:3-deoxy-D-manno-octulosonic acid transferase [Flavobacteriales bacterium]MDF1676502.1 glycosyltransferase N-terminal domain-containing protein [Vicingaceae bacterium]|tara:strand:+ start:12920 stop:14152 length:1233 start_codon:yes stop_codon:yes gene_type:complete
MKLIYQIALFSYTILIRIASLFNHKAKLWLKGRKNSFPYLETQIKKEDQIIWFHCASLGEFEQGKPLMEKIKNLHPEYKLLVTFFSPSGYEYRKDNPLINYVCYLPIDSKKNARKFIELVNPKQAYFVKYEFWYYYLANLHQQNIPTYLISGVFRANQPFFKWYGGFNRKMLSFFTRFFIQNKVSVDLLNSIGFNNVTQSGDTRIDRVYENSQSPTPLPIIEKFTNKKPTIIIGSSWEKEEEIISTYIQTTDKEFNYIIAPHDVSKAHIDNLITTLDSNHLLYSEANQRNATQHNVLIIDNIGILANCYQYTDIALIGGGFSGSLHNILEPASFGNAIIFGEKHWKFHEAQELIDNYAAFSIGSLDDFIAIVNHLMLKENLQDTKNAATKYIKTSVGATDKIWEIVKINF